MDITSAKVNLRVFIGQHGIHGVGIANNEINVYHEKKLDPKVMDSIRSMSKPFSVKFVRSDMPRFGNIISFFRRSLLR